MWGKQVGSAKKKKLPADMSTRQLVWSRHSPPVSWRTSPHASKTRAFVPAAREDLKARDGKVWTRCWLRLLGTTDEPGSSWLQPQPHSVGHWHGGPRWAVWCPVRCWVNSWVCAVRPRLKQGNAVCSSLIHVQKHSKMIRSHFIIKTASFHH